MRFCWIIRAYTQMRFFAFSLDWIFGGVSKINFFVSVGFLNADQFFVAWVIKNL